LIQDEERLRSERTDRRSWKSRVHGLDEYGPPQPEQHQRRRERRQFSDDEDAEYRLAIEASKAQEEEDRRKREGRTVDDADDDDLAKAIKLSKEEEERRRRELEESNNSSIFDDDLIQVAQPTGFNQGYQQGSAVDFFANPIDQNQMQQPTGYMNTAYTGFMNQPTGYPNGFPNGFGVQGTGFDPYGQQQNMQSFQPQPTGFNPYAQQQQQQQQQQQMESPSQPGSNNPWSTGTMLQSSPMKPLQTGSNNPFASTAARPQTFKAPSMPTLGSLPEQKSLSTFNTQPQPTSFTPPPVQPAQQKPMSDHEAKLNALLAGGDGMDTFGNTGQLRIPAQHTAPGTFVNSAGSGLNRLTTDATGSNPFLRTQFTGMPNVSYGAPQSAGPMGGNNPFAARPQQQQNQGDLIQF